MATSRRDFLKKAGLCAAGACIASPLSGLARAASPEGVLIPTPGRLTAKRWAMVIFTEKVADRTIQAEIVNACHSYHNVPSITGKQEVKWIWPDSFHATFTEQVTNFPAKSLTDRRFLMLCNHCENPPCVRVCPTKATFKREDGIVVMDYHRCIGCRFCMAGCPYGARSFNFKDPQPFVSHPNPTFPMRMRGVVEKCTFCSELLAKGEMPKCVQASRGGILFGDLADENSAVRKALEANKNVQRKPSLGTAPGVYYIL